MYGGNSFVKAMLARFNREIKDNVHSKYPVQVAQTFVVVVVWGGLDELQVQIKSWLTKNNIT